ncbi:transglutaminase family protein [Nocardioides montaniterrae]
MSPSLRHRLALSVTGALTTWAALTAWRGFITYPSAYLLACLALGLVLAVVGSLLLERLPSSVVLGVEGAVAVLAVVLAAGGPHALGPALAHGLDATRQFRAPLSPTLPDLTPLLVLGGAACLWLTQVCVLHVRRPPLAGLVLLGVVALPAGIDGVGASALSFALGSAGYLVLLLMDADERRHEWGRTPIAAPAPLAAAGRTAQAAAPIGVGAIVLALLVAAVVPVPSRSILEGFGSGSSRITMHRPVVDMRHDLLKRSHTPLVEITTDEPDPSYLRIAALNRFTGLIWSSGDRLHLDDHTADGAVPLSPGLSPAVPRTAYEVQARVLPAFDSTWLPTAYPISRINADGDWRYDPAIMDFIAAGDTNAAGSAYSMTAERLDYGLDGRFFGDSSPADVRPDSLAVPSTVPTSVRSLAFQVTARGRDDYEKARLLQAYFRDSGLFRYSLTDAPRGQAGQTLATFLSPSGRVGYCEQFASAMAVMARVAGIPARVAVGFLRPHPVGKDTWVYTSDDLHAWPELYFKGAGWVRFEPTPASIARSAPDYSTLPVAPHRSGGGQPSALPTDTASAQPTPTSAPASPSAAPSSPRPSGTPTARPSEGGATPSGSAASDADAGPNLLVRGVLLLLLLAALGALAVVPSVVRRRQRVARLAGGPEDVWAELAATCADLGIPWRGGRSPRETGELLERAVGTDAPSGHEWTAAPSLATIVTALEELRYGRGGTVPPDLGDEAAEVVAALTAAADPRASRLARWLPRSLLRR